MTPAPTFRDFALLALDLRKEQGIRGLYSELNRFSTHIAMAAFAKKPINEIRPVDIRDWLRVMQSKKAKDTRGDRVLSTDTVKRSFALVSSIFTCAVERDVIEASPCREVRVKRRADENATKDKWFFLTMPEQNAVASCAGISVADRFAIRFAIATGLRQGEQFSLELQDLHTGTDSPHVKVRYGSPGHLPPKSGKTREVPLFKDGLVAARHWLYELPTFCPENPLGLVFPSRLGTVRSVGKPLGGGGKYRRALEAAGITRKGPTWHSLRHTAATNLITGALGRRWSLEEIQIFLGHASITVTQRYAHLGADALRAAARETDGYSAHAAMPLVDCEASPDTERDVSAWHEAVAS